MNKKYDTFFCYNSKDKKSIHKIADLLINLGIMPWIDFNELRPGDNWIDRLDEIIAIVQSAIIFIGPSGYGRWQKMEVYTLIRMFVEADKRIIPVFLKGADKDITFLNFLDNIQYIDFCENKAIDKLIFGITGKRGATKLCL